MIKRICVGLMFLMIMSSWVFLVEASSQINSPSFTIDVGTITPWNVDLWDNSSSVDAANNILGRIIDMLIVAFGVLSLLFMTIWAWYMIIYHGQDEFLSRWKSIFTAGLISLAIALSAGMIVRFVAYLLYQ